MNWPFVSRKAYTELEDQYIRLLVRISKTEPQEDKDVWRDAYVELLTRYDALLDKYHSLRVGGANPAPVPDSAPLELPEPDVPPDAVMAAIQQISPTRDRTYEANWLYWEKNKARAATNPDAFAQEILEGAVFEPTVSVMWPDTKAVE